MSSLHCYLTCLLPLFIMALCQSLSVTASWFQSPKGRKILFMSENYRPITLAPTLSKVLEWCILTQYFSSLMTCGLHFWFRQVLSATIATGLIKMLPPATFIVALTFSATFFMPQRLLTLLIMAYCSRGYLRVISLFPLFVFCSFGIEISACRCNGNTTCPSPFLFSTAFDRVAISPVLFTVYLDDLFIDLKRLGVGCH